METAPDDRGIRIATAILLGLVSLVTALGVLQSAVWSGRAGSLAGDAADARDQAIAIEAPTTLQQRTDLRAMLEARRLAGLQAEALADGDQLRALELESEILFTVSGISDLPDEPYTEFSVWRDGGFADDENPIGTPAYLVSLRGDADALTATSRRLGEYADELQSRVAVFGQASLVHALALFLLGIAGINRLRAARVVTLVAGAAVFAFGVALMAGAL